MYTLPARNFFFLMDERRVEAEALGGGEEPLFLPTPPLMASAGED